MDISAKESEAIMPDFLFALPSDFLDYEWEASAKGWFSDTRLTVAGKHYCLNFYDPVRLAQEIESKFETGDVFFEPNLLVVRSVTKANMEQAVDRLVRSGQVAMLAPE